MTARVPQAGAFGSNAVGVIVVDDHALTRRGLAQVIESEPGLRLLGDADGPVDGLSLAVMTKPDVAVVDLVFPNGTGFDLIRDLRAQCPGCKVIVVSAMEGPTYPEQCLRAGAVGYVGKSEPVGQLIRAIRAVGEGRVYLSEDRAGQLLSKFAPGGGGGTDGRTPAERLSPGEFQVFHLIGQGMANADIARVLHRSVKTVETYRSRIKRKIGAANATQLAQLAAGK